MAAKPVTGAALIAANSDQQKQRAPRSTATHTLPEGVLTTALWLSLWIAFGSLALAVADGLGEHPNRRFLIGLLLVFISTTALWQRARVCDWLRTHPWLVLPLAAAQLSAAAADGLIGGPYVAFTMTSIGLAVIVANPWTVWACVALLDIGYAMGILIGHSPTTLVDNGDLAGVLGQMLGYPFAGLSLLGLAVLFKRFEGNVPSILDGLRDGAPALTPALTHAIMRPGEPLALLPGPSSVPRLTATEIRVVEGLAAGKAAKELAHEWGVSLATVRTHIRHAKRKTKARTLPELAALAARPEWPDVSHRGA